VRDDEDTEQELSSIEFTSIELNEGMTGRASAGALSRAVVITLAMGVSLLGQQTAPAPAGAAPQGLIFGRVADAESGAAIPAVVLVLSSEPAAPNRPPRQILADAQGRFVFRNVAAGSYTLVTRIGGNGFSPSGFLVSGLGTQVGPYLNGAYGQRRPNGPAGAIDVVEGERVVDITVRLWRGASIDGTVFDEAGEPLVGLTVAAVRRTTDGRLLTGPTARTDDRGAYHLSTLAPGEYLVVVPQLQVLMPLSTVEAAAAGPLAQADALRLAMTMAPTSAAGGIRAGDSAVAPPSDAGATNSLAPVARGDRTFVYQTTFFPNVTATSRASPITLRSGEERTGVDLHLQPVAAVAVSGTLRDARGPVSNFGVRLLPADSDDGASALDVATTATDGRGAFSFPLVPSGRYTVAALRITPPPPPPGAPAPELPALGVWASQAIAVGDRPVRGLALTLRDGLTVSGRVEFQGASDKPVGAQAQPQVGLDRVPRLSRSMSIQFSARTDASGSFLVRDVMPGRFHVRVLDVPPTWSVQSATLGGREVLDAGFIVTDADITGLVVTYTDQPASITGTVRRRNGGPDVEAAVFLFPADRTKWADARAATRAFRTVRVSKTGTFALTNVIPGEYLVVAAADAAAGDWPDERFMSKLAASATTVRLGAGERPALALTTADIR
jgi:hypothetical protein